MNNYFIDIVIALASSGVFGSIITAIIKKRERENSENIQKIVKAQTLDLQNTTISIQKNLVELAKIIEGLTKTNKEMQDQIKGNKRELNWMENESRKIDLIFLKALREKKILNGESDKIYKEMLAKNDRGNRDGDNK